MSVLLGPPASGKSNILEALELIGRLLRVGVEPRAGLWLSPFSVGPLNTYVRGVSCTDLLTHYTPVDSLRVKIEVGGSKIEAVARCTSPTLLTARVEAVDTDRAAKLRYTVRTTLEPRACRVSV